MYKIIKINNPEIFNQKRYSLWDCVDMEVEYENGITQHIFKNIDEYQVDLWKRDLINKGYYEKDLDILLDLHREHMNQEHCRDDAD